MRYPRLMLRQMTTFVRIAETGSISRAARALGLSVPMASRHLRWLEDEFGTTLMRRTTRRIELTDAGRELLLRSRAIAAGVDEARSVVGPGRGVVGRVVVAVQPAFGLSRIVPLVPALLTRHPRLHLDLRFDDRAFDLVADGVDIAIRAGVGLPDSASVVARRICTYEIVLCAAPEFLAKHGKIRTVAQLARTPCIVLDTAPTQWKLTTDAGPESVTVGGRIHTNHLHAAHRLALAGLGVTWLPVWLVEADLRARRLVRVLDTAVPPTVEVYALFHKQAGADGAVRVVLDHFTAATSSAR